MSLDIIEKLSSEFKKYNILQIMSGASKKKIYRLINKDKSFIVTDFGLEKKEYENYLKIYNLLKDINISIPKIIEKNDNNLIVISDDLGDLRFDHIINKYPIKILLKCAVDSLIILNNSIKFNNKILLPQYNFNIFKNEIMELPNFYLPYIDLKNINIADEFISIWSEAFKNISFQFNCFAHKDYNINNLILLPLKKSHLKCGIIDFQNAFWGTDSWDLFSLLEDSRVLFTDEFNEFFIKYYYQKTDQCISLNEFNKQFHFLNSSRQTRLLGRWIKLSQELNQSWYLDFIPVTIKRLRKSIDYINNKKLTKFYNKYIFNL